MLHRTLFLALALTACAPDEPTRQHVPEVDTQTITANGLEFHYLEEGDGPLVLLLHGFPDTPHTWDSLRPVIAARGYRAVSPFLRGYAPTEIPATDPDAETLGRDVLGLIEAFGEESAIVIGHDWGALSAYSAATLEPERVEALLVVAIPHPNTLRLTPAAAWNGRHFTYLARPSAVG